MKALETCNAYVSTAAAKPSDDNNDSLESSSDRFEAIEAKSPNSYSEVVKQRDVRMNRADSYKLLKDY